MTAGMTAGLIAFADSCLFMHHRVDDKVKRQRKEDGGAKADAPENDYPLQVVQKPAVLTGSFTFHHLLLAGNGVVHSEQGGSRIMAPASARDQQGCRDHRHMTFAHRFTHSPANQ
ncbi:hypothetical protein [Paraburkholderia sp. J63]|uniref:hypothetical protein n=1 Tax=Paraburkholderia sp. J63 TaxID=2805434 RepID=UPI002ABDBC65|nr:hypothetical protein [Paraburkholderia sp. J63]